MLRPFRGDDIGTALRTLIDRNSSHGRFLPFAYVASVLPAKLQLPGNVVIEQILRYSLVAIV
jgi:hypothetical protein